MVGIKWDKGVAVVVVVEGVLEDRLLGVGCESVASLVQQLKTQTWHYQIRHRVDAVDVDSSTLD